jgi:signal transduction histidine kinase
MVVHDLRSPIAAVFMTIDLLLAEGAEPLSQVQRAQLMRCAPTLKRLLGLVNSLLDLGKLEAGKLHLDVRLTRVRKLFEESVAAIAALANSRQISIQQDGDLDGKVAVDAERIIQVVINLLSNAVKFSPPDGTVRLSARISDKTATIIVNDEGPGISEEDRKKIFERFEQAFDPNQPGTSGLGLFISKSIVESHGGNIGVRSTPGQGSSFWFTVPAPSYDGDLD